MTRYIAAYDTEMPGSCLVACRRIREVHEAYSFPATFFIVGQLLENEGVEYQTLLGENPSFEIASHTYSHQLLRDHPFGGAGLTGQQRNREIRLGKDIVEQTFGRACLGMRVPWGFADGLRGDLEFANQVAEVGFGYVSSLLWGPDFTLPALLELPFSYTSEGCPDLWEMPAHGWHENVLKGHSLDTDRAPRRLVAWPMPFPESIPLRGCPITTPEEEFTINRVFIDRAVKQKLPYVSLVWHPWSLGRFDPGMKMLELTFSYVRELGLEPTTYADEWRRLAGDIPRRHP